MTGISPFGLGEGVDASGVTTKMLTCNCSMDLIIDNKSKLFGLHIHNPALKMFFGKLPFAMSRVSFLSIFVPVIFFLIHCTEKGHHQLGKSVICFGTWESILKS